MDRFQRVMPALDLGQNDAGPGGGDRKFGCSVVLDDVVVDPYPKAHQRVECASFRAKLGPRDEEGLDAVQPQIVAQLLRCCRSAHASAGGRGQGMMKGSTLMARDLSPNLEGLILDAIVDQDHVNQLTDRHIAPNAARKQKNSSCRAAHAPVNLPALERVLKTTPREKTN